MDCVTMKLIERDTRIPLDVVVLINSFLYEKLIDGNFREAMNLWSNNKEECKLRFGHIKYWNTSRITDMAMAFYGRRNFNIDISRWNVSNVTDMSWMFGEAHKFNRDISRWDVSKVTNMAGMFYDAKRFNGDLSRWNISNVTEKGFMFEGATAYQGPKWNSEMQGNAFLDGMRAQEMQFLAQALGGR
jgi:surface protein